MTQNDDSLNLLGPGGVDTLSPPSGLKNTGLRALGPRPDCLVGHLVGEEKLVQTRAPVLVHS